jgi:hypothetical protein
MLNGDPDSFEVAVKEDECGGEPMLLADVFTNDNEDPATQAARKLDWELFVATLNDRLRCILEVITEGGCLKEVAVKFKVSTSTINNNKQQLAVALREFFGADILKDILQLPRWRDNLQASREHLACRAERLAA